MSTYEAWRATYQDAEAAAKAAFEQVQGLAKMVDGLQAALGRQVRFGSEAGNPASGAQDKMSTTQQPAALRLADKYEAHGFLGDHRFAKEQWCSQAAVELRRLHAENQDLRTRHYCNTAEIESLQARVQELGEMARENRSKRIVELEQRITEMEDQMAAIGAGGVEPLRKTSADTSALRAALEEAEAALEVATSRLAARSANYPVHVTSEARALEIVRRALGKSHADHFRDATKMA